MSFPFLSKLPALSSSIAQLLECFLRFLVAGPQMGWPGFFRLLALEECLRAVGEDWSGRALHPSGQVGSAEEHWARGVLLLRCPLA